MTRVSHPFIRIIITRAVFTVKGEKSWIHETSLVHIKCLIETSLEKESFYQLYSDSDDDNDSGYTYLWWWWWMMMKQWWGCLIVTSSNQWAGIRQISLFHSGLEYLPACCALVSLTSEQAIHESLVSTNWTSTRVSFWTCTSAIYAVLRDKCFLRRAQVKDAGRRNPDMKSHFRKWAL